MSKPFTRTVQRLGVVACALGFAAGAFVVSSSSTASAGSTPPPLDHFLCYQAKAAGFKVPPNLVLIDALQPNGFAPRVGNVAYHCNPANKEIPGAVFKSKNPLAHLLCWKIASTTSGALVELVNQFGKAVVKVDAPTGLCLPSWKSNIAPPNMPTSAPPGLDHFTCYALTILASSYGFHPANVKAEDEFSAPTYEPIKLGVANRLCVPTTKVVAGVSYPPQTANDLSLVCFPSSQTPIWKLVFDQNQFGTGPVRPMTDLEEFCAPSTVSIQSPAGT
jgi:hypothetical protein